MQYYNDGVTPYHPSSHATRTVLSTTEIHFIKVLSYFFLRGAKRRCSLASSNGCHFPVGPPLSRCLAYPGRLRRAAMELMDQIGAPREMCGSTYESVSLSPLEWSTHGT